MNKKFVERLKNLGIGEGVEFIGKKSGLAISVDRMEYDEGKLWSVWWHDIGDYAVNHGYSETGTLEQILDEMEGEVEEDLEGHGFKLVVQFWDGDRDHAVEVSYHTNAMEAEKAGYRISREYETRLPRARAFQVLKTGERSIF